MAENNPVPAVSADALAAAFVQQADTQAKLVDAFVELKKSQPPRVVEFGDPDYQAQLAKERKRFPVQVFQNNFDRGDNFDATGESDQTIDRVSKLRAGRYIKGKVTVQRDDNGDVRLFYSNKTPDQRMTTPWRSFGELVDLIWAEMSAA